jgi:hypothetical protein
VASWSYQTGAALLLAVGLAASTRDIMLVELRGHLGTVISALTIGVLAKASLIVLVMYAVTRTPTALVLGIAVAQIDPLAVAAMNRGALLSRRARSILSAWASFDDPITVLLTIYATGLALALSGEGRQSTYGTGGQRLGEFAVNLGENAVFVAVAGLLWLAVRRLRGAAPTRRRALAADVTGLVLLAGLIAVGAWLFLMLGVAVAGLFFRPPVGRALQVGSRVAFYVATFGLGMLLIKGIDVGPGLFLAGAAVGAHALVSVPISRGLTPRERAYLAAGQENGMTAVILALLLDRDFPGVVAVVAPAIAVIALIHGVWNGALDRHYHLQDAAGASPPELGPAGRAEHRAATADSPPAVDAA